MRSRFLALPAALLASLALAAPLRAAVRVTRPSTLTDLVRRAEAVVDVVIHEWGPAPPGTPGLFGNCKRLNLEVQSVYSCPMDSAASDFDWAACVPAAPPAKGGLAAPARNFKAGDHVVLFLPGDATSYPDMNQVLLPEQVFDVRDSLVTSPLLCVDDSSDARVTLRMKLEAFGDTVRALAKQVYPGRFTLRRPR